MPTVKDVIVRKPSPEEIQTCRQWPTWQCRPSQFDWDYDEMETCLIIEGEVSVSDRPDQGHSVSFGPGDLVIFPAGFQCIWYVNKAVNKHYRFG